MNSGWRGTDICVTNRKGRKVGVVCGHDNDVLIQLLTFSSFLFVVSSGIENWLDDKLLAAAKLAVNRRRGPCRVDDVFIDRFVAREILPDFQAFVVPLNRSGRRLDVEFHGVYGEER